MKSLKLITHNDLDGIGCAVLVGVFYGPIYPKLEISYVNYDSVDKEIENSLKENWDKIVITDISPKRETCELLNYHSKDGNIELFDHHVTKSWISSYKWATFDKEFSGTVVFYNHVKRLFPDAQRYKAFSYAVDSWDLWKLSSKYRKRGENLNTLYKFIGAKEFVNNFCGDPDMDEWENYKYILKIVENNKNEYVKKVIKDQLHSTEYKMDGLGNTFKVLVCSDYVSEVAHAALTDPESEDLKYIVIVNPITNTCSLRSLGDFDVSVIATVMGGGGHKNASGFFLRFRNKLEKTTHNKLLSLS